MSEEDSSPKAAEGAGSDHVPSEFSMFVWRNRVAWLLAIVAFFVAADQATKYWAQTELAVVRDVTRKKMVDGEMKRVTEQRFVHTRSVDIIPKTLSFIYRENPAAAFSLTRSIPAKYRRPFLVLVSSLAMFFIAAWYFRLRRPDGLLMTAFALIIGGAIGNFLDRVRFGYVVDWVNMYAGFINDKWPPWPTYNIADSCIVLGAGLVVYRTLRPIYPQDEDGTNAPAKPAGADDKAEQASA